MGDKTDVWQGTPALIVLKTLEAMGPLHDYDIARHIGQTSGDLLKLEPEGYIASEWGLSDNNRKAKFYNLTRAGRRQLARPASGWEQTTAIRARFFSLAKESG